MLHVCEVSLHVDKRVARFVIPFCVTINACGSAVFIACSCLFISNFTGNEITASAAVTVG